MRSHKGKLLEMCEKLKGKIVIRTPEYDRLRSRFANMCCQINAIANINGKGRDDLGIDILIAAEDISRRVSNYKSRATRKLAEQIRTSFAGLRTLFRKYGENLDVVDPQLKNNVDLTDSLLVFEKAWEKGKDFLLSKDMYHTLISFSQLIEGVAEKHPSLQEKIETMDADIFILIPCLAILKSLDESDNSIYSIYYPEIGSQGDKQETFESLRQTYSNMKQRSDRYALYNVFEDLILEETVDDKKLADTAVDREEIDKLLHEIKRLAIVLQRSKPSDWNSLMETAMGII